jgi:4-carboxymuconolactone decarboxylase
MSDDHNETMGHLFERGLKLRREVLGAEYVDGSLKSANDFMMTFQHITVKSRPIATPSKAEASH